MGMTQRIRRITQRYNHLRTKYKLTNEDHTSLLMSQDWKCANPSCTNKDGVGNYLRVDHDHKCCPGKYCCGRCIRGLLCHSCNVVLGYVDDNPDLLIGLAGYIKSWKT